MNYKKVFILTCLISLLPSLSFSAVGNDLSEAKIAYFYISGQYKPSTPYFSRFSIANTEGLVSLKKDIEKVTFDILKTNSNFTLPYNPTYKKSLLGMGSTIGYSINNFRVELENFYEKFDLKVPHGYVNSDVYKYFALAEKMDTNPNSNQPKADSYYSMKNSGVILLPILINACYDISLKETGITPYLCLGFGGDVIDFLDKIHFKFSYQFKIGLSYFISQNLAFFVDGSFHKHLDNKFANLLVDYPTLGNFISTSAKLNVNFLSSSIGIRFIF